MKRLFQIFLVLGSAALLIAGLGYVVSVQKAETLTLGIDVSHHQGRIDWQAVSGSDVKFVYMKATEGGDFIDKKFAENWAGADAAGLKRGAYHFFTLCAPAQVQAANFLNVVGLAENTLPPVLDLEHMGPCKEGPTAKNPAASARQFLDRVEAKTGTRPIIYTTRRFHEAYLSDMTGETFWLRSLFRPPAYRKDGWLIWQYSNRGQVDGISGPVDMNWFRGDEDDLSAFTNPKD